MVLVVVGGVWEVQSREEVLNVEEVQSKKPLFVFVFVGVLALAEMYAGNKDIHQPRSIAAAVYVYAGRASMPAGLRLRSRRCSNGHPSRHRSLMHV